MTRVEHLFTIAIEECGELAQRLSKALRFGLEEVQPGQPMTNRERIRYEYSDLAAVLEMIAPPTAAGGLIHPPSGKAMDAKREKVEHFLKYSEDCGTLQPAAPSAPPAAPQEHFCIKCHHRWTSDVGLTEYCGDCHRAALAAPPAAAEWQDAREAVESVIQRRGVPVLEAVRKKDRDMGYQVGMLLGEIARIFNVNDPSLPPAPPVAANPQEK